MIIVDLYCRFIDICREALKFYRRSFICRCLESSVLEYRLSSVWNLSHETVALHYHVQNSAFHESTLCSIYINNT